MRGLGSPLGRAAGRPGTPRRKGGGLPSEGGTVAAARAAASPPRAPLRTMLPVEKRKRKNGESWQAPARHRRLTHSTARTPARRRRGSRSRRTPSRSCGVAGTGGSEPQRARASLTRIATGENAGRVACALVGGGVPQTSRRQADALTPLLPDGDLLVRGTRVCSGTTSAKSGPSDAGCNPTGVRSLRGCTAPRMLHWARLHDDLVPHEAQVLHLLLNRVGELLRLLRNFDRAFPESSVDALAII